MLLGRRKDGFTKEEIIRPSEIPNYVNEENDTTFREKSACLGHDVTAPEPAEWMPPEPMPMYRLLREFIRSQSEVAQVVGRNELAAQDPETPALFAQIAMDPECADIEKIEGQKDVYYYSSDKMSHFVAWVTALVLDDDLPRTIAELTRHNCVTYPAPTLLEYFTLSPFRYPQERIDEAMKIVESDPQYKDICRFTSEQGREYLYSSDKMTERYARALSGNMDRAPVD